MDAGSLIYNTRRRMPNASFESLAAALGATDLILNDALEFQIHYGEELVSRMTATTGRPAQVTENVPFSEWPEPFREELRMAFEFLKEFD
jgi:hypothetical protein